MANYQKKQLLSITISGGATYLYESNVQPESIFTDLGITKVADGGPYPAGGFFEANHPKPHYARKKSAAGWNSSFISSDKVVAAKGNGWAVNPPRYRGIHKLAGNSLVVSVYVTIDGVKYAWNMPKTSHTLIQASLAGLGISVATDADIPTLVWGATAPRPAKVKRTNEAGTDGSDTYSTFCGQAAENSLPAGWAIYRPSLTLAGYFAIDTTP